MITCVSDLPESKRSIEPKFAMIAAGVLAIIIYGSLYPFDFYANANPAAPSNKGEPVRRQTSQDSAIVCIHVPISETSCPLKKSWKLR